MALDDGLNYHHLRYFWATASMGGVTAAAKALKVSASALSSQIHQLESQLGRPLFEREGRSMRLTEDGRIAFEYAENIFATGNELAQTFKVGQGKDRPLRIGALATLSRNFQESFVGPLLGKPNVHLQLTSGRLDDLLLLLERHELDVVLTNRSIPTSPQRPFHCRRIAKQPVSLVGTPRSEPFRFPEDLAGERMLLPGLASAIRTDFDALLLRKGIRIEIHAEVDDMALMRLLARDAGAIALLPSVVVRDELRAGILQEYAVLPELSEGFYATTLERLRPHPFLAHLFGQDEDTVLQPATKRQPKS